MSVREKLTRCQSRQSRADLRLWNVMPIGMNSSDYLCAGHALLSADCL